MILVFGKTGQVAREIAAHSSAALCLGREAADLTNPDACADAIRAHAPRAVINAAAYTAVDTAEDDAETAHRVNADAPAAMARAAAALGVPFVHISTDYVFSGGGDMPFTPQDATAPLNVYGRTKLSGEIAVRAAAGPHAILRTSWVFSSHGTNFVKSMLRLGQHRDALSIVDDQVGGPTPAAAIAEACLTIAEALMTAPQLSGTYHFSGAPDVSWRGFAEEIFATAALHVAVTPIATVDYPTPAERPLNSRLDCTATNAAFGLPRPDWRAVLPALIKDLEIRT